LADQGKKRCRYVIEDVEYVSQMAVFLLFADLFYLLGAYSYLGSSIVRPSSFAAQMSLSHRIKSHRIAVNTKDRSVYGRGFTVSSRLARDSWLTLKVDVARILTGGCQRGCAEPCMYAATLALGKGAHVRLTLDMNLDSLHSEAFSSYIFHDWMGNVA
jgi:hypothetical protein